MSTINDGGPAFPESGLSGLPNGEFLHGRAGMPLRDYFAAKALQSLAAAVQDETIASLEDRAADTARACYTIADAMLEARLK